jgi:hypothetical protein
LSQIIGGVTAKSESLIFLMQQVIGQRCSCIRLLNLMGPKQLFTEEGMVLA